MKELALDEIVSPSWGWREADPVFVHRLERSLQEYGQLRALVVRRVGDKYELVDGRALYVALLVLGKTCAWVVDLGEVSEDRAISAALSLDLRQETDFVSMAKCINRLEDQSVIPTSTRITEEDLAYYSVLAEGFDWSKFGATGQEGLFEDPEEESYAVGQEEPVAAAPDVITPDVETPAAPVIAAPVVTTRPRPAIPELLECTPAPAAPPPTAAPIFFPPVLDIPRVTVEPPSVGRDFFTDTRKSDLTWVAQEPPSLDGIDTISLNLETTGLDWRGKDRPVGITVGTLDGRLKRYLPFGHAGGNLDEATVLRWAQREVRGKHIVNANTKFDIHMARAWGVDLEEQGNTVSDVQHYAALLDDNRGAVSRSDGLRPFSLDALAQDYLGGCTVPRVDETRMASYTAAEVAERAEYQVQLIAELREKMWPLLDAEDLQRVRQLEDDVIFPTCEMERNGAPLDVELLHRWTKETGELLDALLWDVAKAAGFEVNPDKPANWERLFRQLGLPVTVFTESGAPSFTDAVLKAIPHPTVQAARRAGKLASIRSKYLLPYSEVVSAGGILYYNLHQLRADDHGTVSGRFSSSKVNIQQVMRLSSQRAAFGYAEDDASHDDEIYMIRRLFIPRDGLWLCEDARQIEYRLFAHYAEPQSVMDAYAANPLTNYHKHVLKMVSQHRTGVSYSSVKTLNFAKLYGSGKTRVAEMLGLSQNESDAFYDAYDRAFPEAKKLLKTAADIAARRGYVKTYLGRRARFPDRKWTHKALNRVIQGTAADIMKQKIVELHRDRKLTGLTLRFTVHDEVDGDCPDMDSVACVEEVLNRQSFPLKVPILWEMGHGPNWAQAKS